MHKRFFHESINVMALQELLHIVLNQHKLLNVKKSEMICMML